MKRWVPPLEADRKLIGLLHDSRRKGRNRSLRFRQAAAGFSALLHRPPLQPEQRTTASSSCLDHPEGMTLKTREGQSFLCINGIQTMSAQSYNLLDELPTMRDMGIDIIRVSPQPQ